MSVNIYDDTQGTLTRCDGVQGLQYVDVSIKDCNLGSLGYNSIAVPTPTGCIPYSWAWLGNSWDEKIEVSIAIRAYDNVINVAGPANRVLGNHTIRVFYHKV